MNELPISPHCFMITPLITFQVYLLSSICVDQLNITTGAKVTCTNKWRQRHQQKHVHYLSILLQVVVQNLRMGLLMRCQDVHEGSWGVARSSRGVDGSSAPQSRRQAERSCWRASMETLLLKRLHEKSKTEHILTRCKFGQTQ